jgi:hypothetical protein
MTSGRVAFPVTEARRQLGLQFPLKHRLDPVTINWDLGSIRSDRTRGHLPHRPGLVAPAVIGKCYGATAILGVTDGPSK